MSLPSIFPFYQEGITGPFHVSLTIPGPISEISKSVGITASTNLLIPNIQYLLKFANGDIGISDKIKIDMMHRNINKCKTEDTFKAFSKLVKLNISDPSKYKTKNGYSIPKELISVDPSDDLSGIKAMEKTIIKSIFETQKPYIDIAKILVESISKIEDIIARIMPLIAPTFDIATKLSIKSEKPKTNNGKDKIRPKAIGYNNAIDVKNSLGKLDSLSKNGKEVKINRDGNIVTEPPRTNTSNGPMTPSPESTGTGGNYEVISTVYSTGEFNPKVNYNYVYKDIKDDTISEEALLNKSNLSLDDDDPYKDKKPKRIIFGIFNSSGDVLDPFLKLKSLDKFGNEADTPFYAADWITRSPKWYFTSKNNNQSGEKTWNRFGKPYSYWERYGSVTRSKDEPEVGENMPRYNRKKYEDGNSKGQYIVDFSGTNEKTDYIEYFTDLVSKKINASPTLNSSEKSQAISDIINKLYEKDEEGTQRVGTYTVEKTQLDNHIDNVYNYGILNSATFVNPNNNQPIEIPSGLKYPLKPGKIKIEGTDIWIDPESDYDLKVIKVESVLDIRYEDSQGKPETETQILSFIKNSLVLSVNDNSTPLPFSISVSKNGLTSEISENITEYQLDNWNYDDNDGISGPNKPKLNNTNTYNIEMWRYTENPYFIGKPNVSFPSNNGRYIEVSKNGKDWSYLEYSIVSDSTNIGLVDNSEYIIQGSPKNNGEEVKKVKLKSNGSISEIVSWYYTKSSDKKTDWYTTPPSSWSSIKSINWQTSNTLGSSNNGSLPPTKKYQVDKFNIRLSGTSWVFDIIKRSKETRTYNVVSDGRKKLGDGSIVDVSNYKISKWIIWTQIGIGFNSTLDNNFIMPAFQRSKNLSLNYNTFGNNQTLRATSTDVAIPSFQVRVKDKSKYGKMIDPSKITNSHLTNPELYSGGKYGGSPQDVGLIRRYMRTELDTETYYIVEGVLIDDNNTQVPGQSGESTQWYRMPSAIGATKVFLSFLSDIFSKLIPSIKNLLSLFKNPPGFIVDIISEKLGESFSIFSTEAMNVMKRLHELDAKDRSEFIKSSILSNYVYVDPNGEYRFLLDGTSLMKLPILGNTITFGMELSMLKPLIKLISSINFNDIPDKSLNSFLGKNKSKSPINDLGNIDLRSDQDSVKNIIKTTSNGKDNIEEVSIQYSTGDFIDGFDYKYIYITEYVENLVKEADDLEQTNDPDNLQLAQAKIDLALQSDPNNPFLKAKREDLFKKTSNYIQPILKFLIEIVSLPIKIISGIIQYIMDFFKSLSNPLTLASKITDFLSFKWILDFFKPTNLLELAGIKFDIPKLIGWISNIKNIPDGTELDLSEIINISLLSKMPKVKKEQFINMLKKPLRILSGVLCLLESLINAIIDFVWTSIGIEAVIPPPHIKICKQLNEDLTPEDIMDILNGMMNDGGTMGGNSGKNSYDFIYEVKLSDGSLLRDLDEESLRKFIDENKDVNFDFLYS